MGSERFLHLSEYDITVISRKWSLLSSRYSLMTDSGETVVLLRSRNSRCGQFSPITGNPSKEICKRKVTLVHHFYDSANRTFSLLVIGVLTILHSCNDRYFNSGKTISSRVLTVICEQPLKFNIFNPANEFASVIFSISAKVLFSLIIERSLTFESANGKRIFLSHVMC